MSYSKTTAFSIAMLAMAIGILLLTTSNWQAVRTNLAMLEAVDIYIAGGVAESAGNASDLHVYDEVPFAYGLMAIAIGRFEEARAALNKAVGSNPVYAFWLGNAEIQLGSEKEAVEAWRQAGSARYWAWKSQQAARAGEGKLANDLAMRARRIAPDDPEVQYLVGTMYFDQQQWSDALDALGKALRVPTSSVAWYYDALMMRGQVLSKRPDNLALAQVDFQHALALRPDDPWPYLRLCQAFGVSGKAEAAVTACRQGLELAGGSALAHYYMGWALFQAQSWEEAEREFRTSLSLDPNLQAAQDWLAKLEDR